MHRLVNAAQLLCCVREEADGSVACSTQLADLRAEALWVAPVLVDVVRVVAELAPRACGALFVIWAGQRLILKQAGVPAARFLVGVHVRAQGPVVWVVCTAWLYLEGPEEELRCLVLAGAWLQLHVLLLLLRPHLV